MLPALGGATTRADGGELKVDPGYKTQKSGGGRMRPAAVAAGAERGGGTFSQKGGGASGGGELESIYNLLPKLKEEHVRSRADPRYMPFGIQFHVKRSKVNYYGGGPW